LKYLVVAALFSLLFLLIYSRVYPYIQVLKKILGTAKTVATSQSAGSGTGRSTARVDSKLVRCVSCGTWIPSERAIGTGRVGSVYCSRECIEKASTGPKRKAAG